MKLALIFLSVFGLAVSASSPRAAQAPADRQSIEQQLQHLLQSKASDDEINQYLAANHTLAEEFCPSIPEHRDCLHKPTYVFGNEETPTLRLLSYSLRVQPESVTFHLAVVCLRAGSGTLLILPERGGSVLPVQSAEIVCPAEDDTVYLNVKVPGQYTYGLHDAGTADQFMLKFTQGPPEARG